MYIQTNAIILKKINFGQSDDLITFFTRDYGKIEAVCRGARKIKTKLGNHLDYFTICEALIARGKKIDHLAGATVEHNFGKLKNDLNKINFAFYLLDFTNSLVALDKKDKQIFNLIIDYLQLLEKNNFKNYHLKLITMAASFKLCASLGYTPELKQCLNCHINFNAREQFYFTWNGGLFCSACASDQITPITKNDVDNLNFILKYNLADFIASVNQAYGEKTMFLIDNYTRYHLDRDLKSRIFIT